MYMSCKNCGTHTAWSCKNCVLLKIFISMLALLIYLWINPQELFWVDQEFIWLRV